MKKKIVLLITLLLVPLNVFAYSDKIIPGGNTIGITVSTKGIMVVGFYKVNGKYNKGNPELREGDYIIKINDKEINSVSELISEVDNNSKSENIDITYIRNKKEKHTKLNLVLVEGTYKTGLYVKDNITGIGTLSYIDPSSNVYGALGHEIQESSSKSHVDIKDGSIFRNYITGIERSIDGEPGSKTAKFYNNNVYGNIQKNTKYGIYGNYNKNYNKDNAIGIK